MNNPTALVLHLPNIANSTQPVKALPEYSIVQFPVHSSSLPHFILLQSNVHSDILATNLIEEGRIFDVWQAIFLKMCVKLLKVY